MRLADTLAGCIRDPARSGPYVVGDAVLLHVRDRLPIRGLRRAAPRPPVKIGRALCSQPTISRLENGLSRTTTALVDLFCRYHPRHRRYLRSGALPSNCRSSTPITTPAASFPFTSIASGPAIRWRICVNESPVLTLLILAILFAVHSWAYSKKGVVCGAARCWIRGDGVGALVRVIGLLVLLAGTWLVLSGHWDPFLLASGAVACVLVVVIAHRMGAIDEEGFPIHLAGGLVLYLPWLVWQIGIANVTVARTILSPRMKLDPGSGWVAAHQKTPAGLVAFANSITLTPGTVSLSVLPDRIHVHALSRKGLEDLEEGEMDRRVCAMEGRP